MGTRKPAPPHPPCISHASALSRMQEEAEWNALLKRNVDVLVVPGAEGAHAVAAAAGAPGDDVAVQPEAALRQDPPEGNKGVTGAEGVTGATNGRGGGGGMEEEALAPEPGDAAAAQAADKAAAAAARALPAVAVGQLRRTKLAAYNKLVMQVGTICITTILAHACGWRTGLGGQTLKSTMLHQHPSAGLC